MDALGLLAAWVGIVSLLFAVVVSAVAHLLMTPLERWWSKSTPERSRDRIQRLYTGIETSRAPDNNYVSDLVTLYGSMILNLVAAVAVVVVSVEVLDLAPSLLASALPFNVDGKILTRAAGLFLLIAVYWFVFRLSSLAIRISRKTSLRRQDYSQTALREIAMLREAHDLPETMRSTMIDSDRVGDPHSLG